MSLKKTAAAIAVMASGATALIGGAASPALAAGASCTAPYWHKPWEYRNCTTGTITANSKHQISIYIDACQGSPWRVWDTGTGRTIASGTGNGGGINKKVGGLYGTYRAKLSDACWGDYIYISS